MSSSQIGLLCIALGVLLIVAGLLIWSGAFSWFGSLPGDIKIKRDTLQLYIPITSMLLISGVICLILYLVRRLL